MKGELTPKAAMALLSLSILIVQAPTAVAQNNIVNYQGHVRSGGSAFNGAGLFKFALVTTSNQNQTATATATTSGGFVTIINVTFGGSGYVTAPPVTISGGGGSGTTATATISGGGVTSVTVNNPGSGYTGIPAVTLASPPENLTYTTYWSNDGTSAGSEPVAAVSVAVNEGIFTVRLGDTTLANMTALGGGLFTQPDLKLRLWFSDGVNGFTVLHPPQPLTAVPYVFMPRDANNHIAGGPKFSAIAGGQLNTIQTSEWAAIGGGYDNTVAGGSQFSVIAGGRLNDIATNSFYSAVLGGWNNNVDVGSPYSTIGGGNYNLAAALGATIGGGELNNILTNAAYATIGGGQRNDILAGSMYSAIGGGSNNNIYVLCAYGTIAGGRANALGDDADYGAIAGGYGNSIVDFSQYAAIGGGRNNVIAANSSGATISGGQDNTIQTLSSSATISGGWRNSNEGDLAVIGGGQDNSVRIHANWSTIGGGRSNTNGVNATYATIAGGWNNTVNGDYSTIGGGRLNAANGDYATVAGGLENIASGLEATVGGGQNNTASGENATVPGGALNSAAGDFSFAAGLKASANHKGAFVWADTKFGEPFASTADNVFFVRATGGTKFVSSISSFGTEAGGVRLGPGSSAWVSLSDRHSKTNLAAVDTRAVLERLAAIPIQTWNWKAEDDSIRHIGPMAQDFREAFGVGEDERHISTVDADGVALAAIQGLNQKLTEELKRRDAENAALHTRVVGLEQLVLKLVAKKNEP